MCGGLLALPPLLGWGEYNIMDNGIRLVNFTFHCLIDKGRRNKRFRGFSVYVLLVFATLRHIQWICLKLQTIIFFHPSPIMFFDRIYLSGKETKKEKDRKP